jgi:hypothetical protein
MTETEEGTTKGTKHTKKMFFLSCVSWFLVVVCRADSQKGRRLEH